MKDLNVNYVFLLGIASSLKSSGNHILNMINIIRVILIIKIYFVQTLMISFISRKEIDYRRQLSHHRQKYISKMLFLYVELRMILI